MHQMIYLSREHVEKVGLGMAEIVEGVEKAFLEKGKGYAAMPPKHWIEFGNSSFFSAMSGYLINLKTAACKWQSGSPDNPGKGLPYLNGLLIVNEAETGLPLAIMDSTWVTAMRTAAASAVAARYLAKNDSSVMAMIGCGVQGRTNVEAMLVVFPKIEQVRAYDVDENRLEREFPATFVCYNDGFFF